MLRAENDSNKYIAIFASALEKYCHPDDHKRGYDFTLFSKLKLRHSFQYDERLKGFYASFKNQTDDSARLTIANFLKTATKNNHSFACYLMDELINRDPENKELWKSFDPKPIVYYDYRTGKTPYLYRGMRLTDSEALKLYQSGMECKKADLDLLASTHTWNFGISTSKSYSATFAYAAPVITDMQIDRSLMHGEGWIFEIDPSKLPQQSMIDSLATSAARRVKEWERNEYLSWFASVVGGCLAASDEEVNVTESIPPGAFSRLFKIERTSGEVLKIYKNVKELEDDMTKTHSLRS